MTGGGVAAADFWATLSIHIDSHGRDRGDAVDIGADQIALTHSLPLDILVMTRLVDCLFYQAIKQGS